MKIRVNNRVVGTVDGNIFTKRVRGSIHFLRIPPAIAFDIQSLKEAYRAGATDAEIIDKETGKKYYAPFSMIWGEGIQIERGFGKQIALELSKWTCIESDEQLVLFGGKDA